MLERVMLQEGQQDVVVVGAGPVGLFTALGLATSDPSISITVLEASAEIQSSPRAMFYQPVAVRKMDRAGLLPEVRQRGITSQEVCWRRPRSKGDEVIGTVARGATDRNDSATYEDLIIGQDEIASLILKSLKAYPRVRVKFGTRVAGLKTVDDHVQILMERGGDDEQSMLDATWLIGADGAKSSVRKLCGIGYEGFTWNKQVVSANVYYPFDQFGWKDANFLIDPEHWGLVAKINKGGLWRVSYGEVTGLSEGEIAKRIPQKFEAMFPVCSPYGGLGLTGGLLDASALADALFGVIHDGLPEEILDIYAAKRREIFVRMIDPISQANLRRLCETDPDDVGEKDPFLAMIRSLNEGKKSKLKGLEKLWVDVRKTWDIQYKIMAP